MKPKRLLPFLLLGIWGCHSDPGPATAKKAVWSHSPPVCGVDEVRQYLCEELLPRQNALPAPEPYAACPASVETEGRGLLPPTPPVAVFDTDYTSHIRRRMPPGHSCCYSWCAPIKVAKLGDVPPGARCDAVHTYAESYCIDEPEAGSTQPMAAPFNRCPAAIEPPEGVAFSSPPAAPFDVSGTLGRRQQGFRECCYAWCSKPPPSAVEIAKPKAQAPPEPPRAAR